MCQLCVDACREVFPEIPVEQIGNFLFGTTCFPFGKPEHVREELASNRRRMKSDDWRECYAIVDADTETAMATSQAERQ